MADAELNIDAMTTPGLIATATGIGKALEGNEHFPNPEPSGQALRVLAAELSAADAAYRDIRQRALKAQTERDTVAEKLRSGLAQVVAYVQQASSGDAAKILSANLHVEEETSLWPFGGLEKVEEVAASVGDQPGEIDLVWDPVPDASGYEVEIAYDLTGAGPWEQIGASTKSRIVLSGLNSRTRCWLRVRAISDKPAGDWSDPVMKFTP